jgi:hypothetical protein
MKKKLIAFTVTLFMVFNGMLGITYKFAAESGTKGFTIINPYKSVDWTTYGQYKANFHSHTVESDGGHKPAKMIEDHYEKGYDVMAITDHNFTNTTWDRTDANSVYLTSERLAQINSGSDREGRGLIGIPFSTEQSLVAHLNTFWADFVNESGATLEKNIAKCEALGGISHINHPGRSTGGKSTENNGADGAAASGKPSKVKYYADLFKKYPSCVGMEIINKKDGDSYSDRILWDNILKQTMPDRPVWGFSNDDTHTTSATGFSYNVMVMPENTLKSVRSSMENGTFYAVAKVSRRELGEDFAAKGPMPVITNIVVNEKENSIALEGENYTAIEWIADGSIIAKGNSIDLNDYESQIGSYIRVQLKGEGGIVFAQPFGIIPGEIITEAPTETAPSTGTGTESEAETITETRQKPEFPQRTFDDIQMSWAKEQIEELASRGVINGTSQKTFSPDNKITRADFIIMLMRVLDKPSVKAEEQFSDVSPRDYYYEEVHTARALGITEGVGKNRFNPKGYITRQDMMVLIDRTLEVFGISLEGTFDLTVFTDKSSIKDYAKESASKLAAADIIKGSEGRIRPQDNLTRAEASVVINSINNSYFTK